MFLRCQKVLMDVHNVLMREDKVSLSVQKNVIDCPQAVTESVHNVNMWIQIVSKCH